MKFKPTLLVCLILAATAGGCAASRTMPEASAQKIEAVVPNLIKVADASHARGQNYAAQAGQAAKAASVVASTPIPAADPSDPNEVKLHDLAVGFQKQTATALTDEANAYLIATGETGYLEKVSTSTAGTLSDAMGTSKPTMDYYTGPVIQAALPVIISATEGAASGGPLGAIIAAVTSVVGILGAAKGASVVTNKIKDYKIGKEIDRAEDAVCDNPDHGAPGVIAYNDPKTRSKFRELLGDEAYNRLYPQG